MEATTIEVTLNEMLDWSHQYEYFSDLIRDRVAEQVPGMDYDEVADRVLVTGYILAACHTPNVGVFEVAYELEEA